jgi:fido (protein-threonine AMPylation protein)
MPRISDATILRELDQIVEIVSLARDGASRDEIETGFQATHGRALPPRTMQRRLERLVVEGRIHADGESKSTLYRLPVVGESGGGRQPGEWPLSAQGTRLRNLVLRPIGDRDPVGYDRDWLFDYIPGKTWYLTKAHRTHLREVGETADDDRPAATFARDILSRLLIDLAWASSRLEGNTYTRLDTQNLLEFGQRAEGKDASETQMILNHKAAIEYVVGEAEETELRRTTILSVHAALSENLLDNPGEEGRLRERPVSISGTSYTPTAIPQVIREAFERIVETMNAIPDPFEQALFSMVHIAYLQPFVDVNKRTSRLVANLPLIRANLCPLSFVGVDEQEYVLGTLAVYEQRRTELLRDFFIKAYERSAAQYRVVRASVAQPDPIRLRYRNELREAVREVVVAGEAPSAERLRGYAERIGIPAIDLSRFSEVALELLLNLNDGSASRYGLRPAEFVEWERRVRVIGKVAP